MNKRLTEELDLFCRNEDLSFLNNKSVMITGASGLIGSYLVDAIMRNNTVKDSRIHVYAVIRNAVFAAERFKTHAGNPLFHYVEHDVSEPADFKFPVDYIIHAAGNANPAAFDRDPVGTIKANVLGTMYLLDYAGKCGAKRLVFLSSAEVYGEPFVAGTVFDECSMGAVDPMKPRSCYTESKRMAENTCVSYFKQFGIESCVARVGFAYGSTFTDKDNRVIPQFLRRAINGEDIILKSTGSLVRSYIYIFDAVSGIFRTLKDGTAGEAYNIANRRSDVSIRTIAETIAGITGVELIFDLPEEDRDKAYAPFSAGLLDAGKLEKLGWRPSFDIRKGLESTISILREAE